MSSSLAWKMHSWTPLEMITLRKCLWKTAIMEMVSDWPSSTMAGNYFSNLNLNGFSMKNCKH